MGDFVDPRGLIADALEAALPPQRRKVAEIVAELRYLTNAGGGTVGRFVHEPYTREIEDCLDSVELNGIAIVGPGQSAKTTVVENWLFASIVEDPAGFLWYMPTDALMDAFVKDRINTMIESHECLNTRQMPGAVNDSLEFKKFRGMSAHFMPANAGSLIAKNAPRIVLDEVDKYAKSLGNVWHAADIRRQYYGDSSMMVALSHCDRALGLEPEKGHWDHGIMAIYAKSDRRLWHWPCPHCGGVSSPLPTAARRMVLKYDARAPLEEIKAMARLECPLCEALIEESHREAMNAAGLWVGQGEEIDADGCVTGAKIHTGVAGFWIHGFMSRWTAGGWGGLAADRVDAERKAARGDDTDIKTVMPKRWGEPYCPKASAGNLDAQALRERAEGYLLKVVPEGAGCLFGSLDINGTWIEAAISAFAPTGESWLIDHLKIAAIDEKGTPIALAKNAAHWQIVVDRVLKLTYPLAGDPTRAMGLRCAIIDSAGEAGVTDLAFAAWRRWSSAAIGVVRRLGRNRHKVELYSAMLSKGASAPSAPRLQVSWPNRTRSDRRIKTRGDVPVLRFNPNSFKDTVATRLDLITPEADHGAADVAVTRAVIHLPAAFKKAEGSAEADFFDGAAAEVRDKAGHWTKRSEHERNEPLDLLVQLAAVAELFGIGEFKSVPAWASPDWSINPLVTAAVPAAPAAAATPATPAPQAPGPRKSLARLLAGGRR